MTPAAHAPAGHQVPDPLLDMLVGATCEVFSTMVLRTLERRNPIHGYDTRPASQVVATVALAGYRSGVVSFHSTFDGAREITGALLSMPPDQVNGELTDAMGEVANMVAGSFRTRLAATEPPSVIAVPSVTMGSDFSTRFLCNGARVLCPFTMGDREIVVELILEAGAPSSGLPGKATTAPATLRLVRS